MVWIVVRSFLFGLLGLVLLPVATFALVLFLGYTFDPRCGTAGDSAAARWARHRWASPPCCRDS